MLIYIHQSPNQKANYRQRLVQSTSECSLVYLAILTHTNIAGL